MFFSCITNPLRLLLAAALLALSAGRGDSRGAYGSPFPPGERLVYRLCVGPLRFPAGRGTFTFLGIRRRANRRVFHVLSRFIQFGGYDEEEIYGTYPGYLPLLVKREIKPLGLRMRRDTERYDQEGFRIDIVKGEGPAAEFIRMGSDREIHNIVLLLYYLREQPLEVGRSFPINLPADRFDLKVVGRETVEVPLGRFDSFVLQSDNGNLTAWISSEKSPLVVKASLVKRYFGRIEMRLAEVSLTEL